MQEQIGTQAQHIPTLEPGEHSALDAPGGSLTHLNIRGSATRVFVDEYAELKRLIMQKGLLEKQPIYYVWKILLTMGLLALSLIFLLVVKNFWLQLLNATYLGFVLTQIGFVGHDIGHRQIFRTTRNTTIASLLVGNFLLGWSWGWWIDRHNQHHGRPNHLDVDPDIAMPFMAFTEEEAMKKQGFLRSMTKYQAYLFFPMLLLVAFSGPIWGIQFLLQKKSKHPLAETLFIVVHYVLFFGLLFWQLNVWQAVVFYLVNQALGGLYFGSVFAPNHKGMPILDKDIPLDFLSRQVLTARDVRATPFTDFWYGGLNYQIEHHLFPTIPRNKLRETQQIVRAFCKEHSVAYHETGMLQSYREILQCLHEVSAPLRRENA
jgi:fatty acid desaturase